MMRMVPDQCARRIRASRTYPVVHAGSRSRRRRCCGQRRTGPVGAEDRDGDRATPNDAPSALTCACHGAWNGSRGRRTWRWRYAPFRFDFSGAPPVWVRGAARGAGHRWSGWAVDLVTGGGSAIAGLGRCPDSTRRAPQGHDVPRTARGLRRPNCWGQSACAILR